MSDISSLNNFAAGALPYQAKPALPTSIKTDIAKVPAVSENPVDIVQLSGKAVTDSTTKVAQPASVEDAVLKTGSRKEVVEQAALKFASQTFYPVSSVRFTIYKASNGEYVTRFTNLLDGSVNYVPEPELMQNLVRSKEGEPTLVGTYA
ncbi:hypothetical protein GC177_07060 [bacterium]|nr:hypothetical protein [bacterium]